MLRRGRNVSYWSVFASCSLKLGGVYIKPTRENGKAVQWGSTTLHEGNKLSRPKRHHRVQRNPQGIECLSLTNGVIVDERVARGFQASSSHVPPNPPSISSPFDHERCPNRWTALPQRTRRRRLSIMDKREMSRTVYALGRSDGMLTVSNVVDPQDKKHLSKPRQDARIFVIEEPS